MRNFGVITRGWTGMHGRPHHVNNFIKLVLRMHEISHNFKVNFRENIK